MSDSIASRWITVGRLEELPRLGARVVRFGTLAVAVFRTSSDRVFALHDSCPHRGGPLSQGIVHGDCVTCPLHDWVINLETGEARGPDEGSTRCYPVRLDGEMVMIDVPESAIVDAESGISGSSSEPVALAQ